jgi:large subunit ribosomal protein L53
MTRNTSTNYIWCPTEDGKEMNLDLEKMKIREIQNEVDRHSRQLKRQEELNG